MRVNQVQHPDVILSKPGASRTNGGCQETTGRETEGEKNLGKVDEKMDLKR